MGILKGLIVRYYARILLYSKQRLNSFILGSKLAAVTIYYVRISFCFEGFGTPRTL